MQGASDKGMVTVLGALGFPLDRDLKGEEEFSRQTHIWRERQERGGVDVCACVQGGVGAENRNGSVSDTAENMCSATSKGPAHSGFSVVQRGGPSHVKCVCVRREDSRQGQVMMDAAAWNKSVALI